MDAEGCVWISLYAGWEARCYAPAGELVGRIRFPVANITKIAFGGDDLRTVYASTARQLLSPPARGMDDPFYGEIDYTWDVYRAIKAWQEALFANTDYRNAITAFAPHMLVKSGSRKAKRPGGPGQQLEETSRQPLPQPQAGPVTERYRQRHHQGEQRSEQQCGQDRQQPHGEAQSPHTAALKWRA